MSADEYVPSEGYVRAVWVVHERDCGWAPHPGDPSAEFDRFLARVKRDAAREALDRAVHVVARLEAQTGVRGRAAVMHRERARDVEARIKAVRDVHTGTFWPGVADKPICDACDHLWPCDTIRALD